VLGNSAARALCFVCILEEVAADADGSAEGDGDDSRSMESSYSGSVDRSDLYDSRKYDSRNYDSYRRSPRMDPAQYRSVHRTHFLQCDLITNEN